MKKISLFLIVISAFIAGGCDVISESDRIIEMDEVIPLKKVLLLDFTDQACPNCPKASVAIANLKTSYGDAVIPVTIHASSRNLPLVTKDGNTYDEYFGTKQTGHPAGVIDGTLSPNYDQWGGNVLTRFNVQPSLTIDLSSDYNSGSREVTIVSKLKGFREIPHAKLLLWIIENNIIDQQLVDNTVIKDYEHHSVFRAAVNTTWGENLSLSANEEKKSEHSYTLNENWKPENSSIVGFVYNADTDEVFDVNEISLLK
jgi:hypothetical protein